MGTCIKQALKVIISHTQKVSYEIIPIENAQDRISAENIYARYDIPMFNNSAMDGYCVKLCDISKNVIVVDTIFAGQKENSNFSNEEAIKIMTGGRVPKNTEAIVPIEEIEVLSHGKIKLPNSIHKNQHIRFMGEEIKKNEQILSDGDEISFSTISVLSSQGITHIKVYRKPKVCVFTSGEELKLHYEKVQESQLYNSNTPTLLARAKELGADVTFTGMAHDSIKSLKDMISNSLYADFIITSGGISVGDADFTKDAFNHFNMDILFDTLTIKPGKPTRYGKIGSTYILNLPGNPLAASMIFEVFGKTILQILTGNKNIFHNHIIAKMKENFDNKKGRTTLIPGWFDGEYFLPTKKRLPGMVGVLHHCNSMIILNKYCEHIAKDTFIKVLPINWKFFTNTQKDFFN